MDKNSLKYIKDSFDSLSRLTPFIPPDMESRCDLCPGIKAVLFDIYGTLLVSASGDYRQEKLSQANIPAALRKSGIRIESINKENVISELINKYNAYIEKYHAESKKAGIQYPEINILDLWNSIINELAEARLIKTAPSIDLKTLAAVFELSLNPVYPMPFMTALVQILKKKYFVLGAVSNAQFYTPMVMNYFIDNEISFDENIKAFNEDLCIFSYKSCIAKPGIELFEKASSRLLEKYNIRPQETLFIGNDMLNDIYPAGTVGFKTVLFAGDSRSLRKRENHPLAVSRPPDYVIKDLKELLKITGIIKKGG